jgi:SAM-dependent methyltransferase
VAEQYDQSGVPWFQPIAQVLVDLLEPQPGERFLELGSGRGPATIPLARAVGTEGAVDAVDVAPAMVRLLQEDAARLGLTQVRVAQGDAAAPADAAVTGTSYDGVLGSLMLFFLPDPVAALRAWRKLLRPGGRAGIATFPLPTGRFGELVDLVVEYAGEGPSPRGDSPFDSDEGVADLFRQAGYDDIRTTTVVREVPFVDLDQWRAWSMATPLRRVWTDTDPARHPEILSRADEILARDDPDRLFVQVPIRYTLARA